MSSSRGPIPQGLVAFYASCTAYANNTPSAWSSISPVFSQPPSSSYSVTLPPGTYLVRISNAQAYGAADSWHNGVEACADATPVTVSAGNSVVNLLAQTGIVVSGEAYENSSGDLNKYSVSFYATCDDYINGRSAGTSLGAGENGMNSFVVVLRKPGTYRVLINAPWAFNVETNSWHERAATCDSAKTIQITQDTSGLVLRPRVRDTVTLWGNVMYAGYFQQFSGTGKVSFYASCADYANGKPVASSSIGQFGYFQATVPKGQYLAYIQPDGDTIAESWHEASQSCESPKTTLIDASSTWPVARKLLARRIAGIGGSVTSTNGAVSSGEALFFDSCQAAADGVLVRDPSIINGRYSVRIPEGDYRVLIAPGSGTGALDSWNGGADSCEDSTAISVGNDDNALALTAASGYTLTGPVITANGPVMNGDVAFYKSCDAGSPAGQSVITSGTYQVTVASGTYRAVIRPGGAETAPSWHKGGNTCEEAAPITVTEDATLALEGLGDSQVSGAVSSSAGPMASGTVTFFTDCKAFAANSPTSSARVQNGSYRTVLRDGTYRALITADGGTALTSWHEASGSCEGASLVTVRGNNPAMGLVASAARSAGTTVPEGQTGPSSRPTLLGQSIKPLPRKIKKGKKIVIVRTTNQGSPVRWRTQTKRTCSVKASTIKGLKVGRCELSASSPGIPGYSPFNRVIVLRVR